MKTSVLKVLGFLMIIVGLAGVLLIYRNLVDFSSFTSGFAIEEKSLIEFSELNDLILRGGDKKTLTLNIKNNNGQLTNCKLVPRGFTESWIYSAEIKSIAPKEAIELNFDINVPEQTAVGEYLTELEFTCNEKSEPIKFYITIIKGVKAIEIKGIKAYKNILEISYTFDNRGFIGDFTSVEIGIKTLEGSDIKTVTDQFSIKTDNLIERNVIIQLPEINFGTYGIYLSHPSDPENYIKKLVVIGQPVTTGKAIFKIVEGKGLPYLIFLIVIGLGVYFIFRSHKKSLQEIHEKEHV